MRRSNNSKASATTVVDDICNVLATHDFTSEEMTRIFTAAREASTRRQAQARLQAQATLRIGTSVVLHGLRPKALNGVEGNVKSFNSGKTRAAITITSHGVMLRNTWLPKGDEITGIPVQCLEVKP